MNELRLFLRLFLYIFIPLIAVMGTYSFMDASFFQPIDKNDNEPVLVEIAPNMTFKDVSRTIAKQGVVRHAQSLQLIAKLRGMNTDIKPGEYVLSKAMTPRNILERLVSGEIYEREISVQSGSSVWDIGKLLEEAGLLEEQEFNINLTNPSLLAKAGISAQSFEGYLYPDTYKFSRPVSAESVIWRMMQRGEQLWPEEYSEQASKLRLSRHEILTIASIIQKESRIPSEFVRISSVIHNRLSQGMKLQSDPTVVYALPEKKGYATDEDRNIDSPYNTYLNFGLPPGPICNPGEDAIRAALFPEDTAFLFYLDSGSGHIFSSTQNEHEEAMARVLNK